MEDLEREFEKIKNYEFDFENLAFEGGGVKMASYIGVVKVLEAMGQLKKCKRFAGTSGGSIVAMLLAIDLNALEVRDFLLALPVQDLVGDSPFGPLALLPNVVSKYGWNPANKFLSAIRKMLKNKTGDSDITFQQVYKRYNKSLCIVATNVSTMTVEYFHPKTTPNTPVALAVRASISLPGYMQPVRFKTDAGLKQYFADGGLVCNFPIHAFDGWFLSMDPEDSFFNKIGQTDTEFSTFNPKTLGFILYTPWEGEFMQGELHARYKNELVIKRPRTPLAKLRGKKCEKFLKENLERQEIMEAGKRFLAVLREMDVDKDFEIDLIEFKHAFEKLQITEHDVELLFGKGYNFSKAFMEMDQDVNGKVTFDEFVSLLQRKGVRFTALLEGGHMMNINSFGEFFETAFNTILNMSRKIYFKNDDIYRTCGIYTDYVDTSDFGLMQADKRFLVNQGIKACLAYFQDIISKHNEGTLPESMQHCVTLKEKDQKDAIDGSITISIDINENETAENESETVQIEKENKDWEVLKFESIEKENYKCVIRSGLILGFVTFLCILAAIVCTYIFYLGM